MSCISIVKEYDPLCGSILSIRFKSIVSWCEKVDPIWQLNLSSILAVRRVGVGVRRWVGGSVKDITLILTSHSHPHPLTHRVSQRGTEPQKFQDRDELTGLLYFFYLRIGDCLRIAVFTQLRV
jgi:hypothetical protein